MNKTSKIFVAGHKGLVGSAIVRALHASGYVNVLTTPKSETDLSKQSDVDDFFKWNNPEYVFLAAAKVGGIHANDKYPADFIYENLAIQTNIIEACRKYDVKKMLFLGSVCIYPKFAEVPVHESSLLTGELEPTNQWYAIAKIAGIKMCQAYRKQFKSDFISVMPCNLYGEGDNFHLENSHVIPALIRKFITAKEQHNSTVTCWGDGSARREFLYVDDLADACLFLMDNYSEEEIINIGYGSDYTIKELVNTIAELTEYKGNIIWDTSKPNGTPKRLLDNGKLWNMGWTPKYNLNFGLTKAIEWYKLNKSKYE